jgi:hypothetical protein
MSLKLKALGLGLLATMAIGAFAGVNASAEDDPKGHFVSDSPNGKTVITGTEKVGTAHGVKFTVKGLKPMHCESVIYDATASANTVTSITATPTYNKCTTEGGTPGETTVHHNGCNFTFTVGKESAKDNTVHLLCPVGVPGITITHAGCEIEVTAQTLGGGANLGVAYTKVTEGGKHAITLDATVKNIKTHFEKGFCVLLGTNQLAEFTGAATVEGFEDLVGGGEGPRVGITATGSIN